MLAYTYRGVHRVRVKVSLGIIAFLPSVCCTKRPSLNDPG